MEKLRWILSLPFGIVGGIILVFAMVLIYVHTVIRGEDRFPELWKVL